MAIRGGESRKNNRILCYRCERFHSLLAITTEVNDGIFWGINADYKGLDIELFFYIYVIIVIISLKYLYCPNFPCDVRALFFREICYENCYK